MSDHLEFRLLKYIVAVTETANFTRASERLFLAQPTLSQQVIALEEAIGVRIFVRRREGIHLTPAGQMLYAYAQEMLDLRDEVVSAARAMDRGEIPALRSGLAYFNVTGQCLYGDQAGNLYPADPVSGQVLGPASGRVFFQNGQYIAVDSFGRTFLAIRTR